MMLLDSGTLQLCCVKNTAPNARMPVEELIPGNIHYYGECAVGYGRQYAAMGVSQQVDLLARIWQDKAVRIGMIALLDTGEQYRIDHVQHLTDEDGLKVTDLTLRRLDELYDVSG